MHKEPSIVEKIATLKCLGELEGAVETIEREGTMTPQVKAALATRRAELLRHKITR